MFDTMTLTKATGAVCGSLLVFLLGSWAAEAIYSVGGGHGEQAQGYVVDTGEDDAPEEAEETGPDLPELLASADASKGERVFNQCRACHMLEDGQNGVGPHLYGVVARDVGSVDGFNYSGALSEAADVWSAQELYAFLENPAEYAPGTSMGYSGLSKPEDRVNVIAYLDETDGTDNLTIEASAEDTSEDAAAADDAATEDQATEEAAQDEAASGPDAQEGSDTAAADAEAADEAASDEGAADEAATEDAAAEEAASEEAAAEDTAAEEGANEDAAAEEAATEDAAAEDTAAEEAATGDDAGDASGFAAMVASADVDAGKRAFRQCSACHAVDPGRNMVGPSVHGVVGRDIASAEGFRYSDALMGLDGAWTPDELSAWLENPREYAPGNRMGYPGLKDEQDRANVVAYMDSLDD